MTTTTSDMEALVFRGPGDAGITRRAVPSVEDGEILVAVKYAAVCGTDVRILSGTKRVPAPRILGHEFAGEIVEVGDGVQGFRPGDRVTVYPMIACGHCHTCLAGRPNICVNRITIGYEIDGGFAEFVKVPKAAVERGNVLSIPPGVTFKEAAVSELFAAAYNGVERAHLTEGMSCAIIGAGPIGLIHVQLISHRKPSVILVSEPLAYKRQIADALGADVVVDPATEDLRSAALEATDSKGVDVVLVDVASPGAVQEALSIVKKGGRCVLFAGFPAGGRVSIDPNLIHYGEIDLTGSSASSPAYHKEVLSLMAEGRLNTQVLITAELPLSRWKEAFDMKANFQGLKTVLQIGE